MGASEVKTFDDRCRAISEALKQANETFWSGDKINFADDYLGGKLELGIWCPLGPPTKNGFIFSCYKPTSILIGNLDVGVPATDPQASAPLVDFEKSFVLADNVEVVDGVKRVIPSFVRLVKFEDFPSGSAQLLYEFRPLVVSPRKIVSAVGDGKVNIVRMKYGWRLSHGKRPSEDIEAASNCVDVSPGFDTKRDWQVRLANYHQIVRAIRWCLTDHDCTISIEPSIYPSLEGWYAGFGPIH